MHHLLAWGVMAACHGGIENRAWSAPFPMQKALYLRKVQPQPQYHGLYVNQLL